MLFTRRIYLINILSMLKYTLYLSVAAISMAGLFSCGGSNSDAVAGDELLADSSAALSEADVAKDTAFVPGATKYASLDSTNAGKLEKMDALLIDYKLKDALAIANDVLASDSANVYALSRKSIIYTRMALEADGQQTTDNLKTAGDLGKKAFKLDPKDATANLALAVYYGAEANEADITKKMEFSKLIKKYADRTLQLSPMHPEGNYVMGRWYYGLADLGKVKKMVAQKIVKDTGAQEPTFELALSYFRKSLKAAPDNLSYNYFVGASLYKMDKEDEAKPYIAKAKTAPAKSKQERKLIADIGDFE
jgi:tetratricopeptide (TPR) repeat protein